MFLLVFWYIAEMSDPSLGIQPDGNANDTLTKTSPSPQQFSQSTFPAPPTFHRSFYRRLLSVRFSSVSLGLWLLLDCAFVVCCVAFAVAFFFFAALRSEVAGVSPLR
ncbi:hypothetical protein ASPZODRAFT_14316 [Penicilliopsis zonata CBS 506.65]|uniref:Copper transporter n=1 Tax=Penicilliopsis zonata CBS 506.65 TaxID=1073090 RepID=A0A1L9SM33_9EURO|nr:hypothetical protein ASPZODRAFT_14316 [Penicilliopsis zonata CBS 506.65]OJJ48166.1 hypothetical protein ASPZODRAFT_14316 [Penicilliopsis zonata CBS 506.65]